MKDTHIHLEQGPFTIEWFNKFVDSAINNNLEEIWIVEHSYRFKEFEAMYHDLRLVNDNFNRYYQSSGSLYVLDDYIDLIKKVKLQNYPIKIRFGLEVCYIPNHDELVRKYRHLFDFYIGSIHYIDDFCYDINIEQWNNIDVNSAYIRYYELNCQLVESQLFDVLGHPDAIKLFDIKPDIDLTESYQKLVKAIKDNPILVEQSSGIERRSFKHPELGVNQQLLEMLVESKANFTLVSDAHHPDDIGYKLSELQKIIDDTAKRCNL